MQTLGILDNFTATIYHCIWIEMFNKTILLWSNLIETWFSFKRFTYRLLIDRQIYLKMTYFSKLTLHFHIILWTDTYTFYKQQTCSMKLYAWRILKLWPTCPLSAALNYRVNIETETVCLTKRHMYKIIHEPLKQYVPRKGKRNHQCQRFNRIQQIMLEIFSQCTNRWATIFYSKVK